LSRNAVKPGDASLGSAPPESPITSRTRSPKGAQLGVGVGARQILARRGAEHARATFSALQARVRHCPDRSFAWLLQSHHGPGAARAPSLAHADSAFNAGRPRINVNLRP